MSPEVDPMEGTGGMGETSFWFVTLRGGISVLFGVASTFGLGGAKVAKGRTGMELGGRSF
jgi:hypothetical protein